MSVSESIRQAIKLRKESFAEVYPDHVIERTYSDNNIDEEGNYEK